jgi:hypothetical protein
MIRQFLSDIHLKEFIDDDTLKNILECKDLQTYFQETKQSGKKKSSVERSGVYFPDKCQVRIWKEGFDNIQCDMDKTDGCFCKRHANKVNEHGTWWLGLITDERPEHPIHYNGTKHSWKKDTQEITESETIGEKEKPKKKRGRPPGSKNKTKKTKQTINDNLNKEELIALISLKEKEKEKEKEKLNGNEYILDGITYFKNDDGGILDTSDFSFIGRLEEVTFSFMNKVAEEKHNLKINLS